VKILFVAKKPEVWSALNPILGVQAYAKGFEANGHTVFRSHPKEGSAVLRRKANKCDFIFFCKLGQAEIVYRLGKPTACVYGDWRNRNNNNLKFHARADLFFPQFEMEGGKFLPAPIWADAFDPGRKRNGKWLWTGQHYRSKLFDGLRDRDVPLLPVRSSIYGYNRDRITGRDYIRVIETHSFGLSVSNRNDVQNYSSSRLGHYLMGGLTCCVRKFPGIENLTPPGTFSYSTGEELQEFIKNPTSADPTTVHEYARSVYDGRVLAAQVIEEVEKMK
jgi:hypothetical protein